MTTRIYCVGAICLAFAGFSLAQENPRPPYSVKIQDDKVVVVEADMPVDPQQRIRVQPSGNFMIQITDEQGRTLHLSHYPTMKIDERIVFPGNGKGRFQMSNAKLPKTASGKERNGFMTVYIDGNIHVTQTVEVVPTKSQGGQKRRLDSVLVRYSIENKGKDPHKVGLRVYMDTYVIDNDGCLYAAPTMPGKILNGIELKDKTMPDYLQQLQRPDLKNPGFVAHVTINLGPNIEKMNRLYLTHHGSDQDSWNMNLGQSQGDSAIGMYWDPKEIKPGGKREIGYAHGQGIAVGPEAEGRFQVKLGGSFEPGKVFTIASQVVDPATGQTLTLELPKGMTLVEGKAIQPVPDVIGERAETMVMWKASVVEPGNYVVRVRSNHGVTQAKIINITKN